MPLPSPETTPPVTNMYLVIIPLSLTAFEFALCDFRNFFFRFALKTGVNIPFEVFKNEKGRFFLETPIKFLKKRPEKLYSKNAFYITTVRGKCQAYKTKKLQFFFGARSRSFIAPFRLRLRREEAIKTATGRGDSSRRKTFCISGKL